MATVLVVDDSATSREVARATLDHAGHHVLEASNGRDALALACSTRPELIITDLLMPGLDGYGFVRELRADAVTADIPVLFYTANYRPEEAQPLADAYGVATVLPKSAHPTELLSKVDQALLHRPSPPNVDSPSDDSGASLASRHLHMVHAKLVEKTHALDESQAQLSTVAELSPFGIVVGTAGGAATYVNRRLVDITQIPAEQLLGRGWLRCLPRNRWPDVLDPSGPSDDSWRCRRQVRLDDGSHRWLDAAIRQVCDSDRNQAGFVAMIDDVTAVVEADERRRAEEREREIEERRRITDRFDCLARLSVAVAHDFNNMLNVILAFDEFLDETVGGAVGAELTDARAQAMRSDLARIKDAGQRAAHLAHQLLAFGGREIVRPTVIDIAEVIRDLRCLVAQSLGPHVSIQTDVPTDLHRVRADGGQLRQVLLNVVTNAVDAMPDGGQVFLRAANAIGSGDGGGIAGDFVHLEVIDTGVGMEPQVMDHAMEPFFTTKPGGPGAGLGLATAYGIVRQIGGQLSIESVPGHGTTVHLHLPATTGSAEAVTGNAPTAGSTGRTVLVAEDESALREVALRVLTSAGYRVLAAVDGEEALAVAEAYDGAIDIVLSDVVMPKMNGRELAEALRRSRPATPVLFMSGYAAPLMTDQGLLEPGVTVLGKPFTKAQLLDLLDATLASAPTEAAPA
jgi:two-component system, cell cycle sensor histidine kinase and response regulator CckA